MKIADVFNSAYEELKKANIKNSKSLCFILFCKILKKDKAWVFAHFDDEIDRKHFNEIKTGVKKLSENIPIHYVTEEKEFMSLSFHVNQSVLIPRYETELLVEEVISYCKKNDLTAPDILELGTGSGCICVSLAHHMEHARVISVEVSQDALKIADRNVRKYNLENRVMLLNGDMLKEETYSKAMQLTQNKGFDMIVSNPPYICSGDISGLEPEVRGHEPYIALDGGDDGLRFYHFMSKHGPSILKQNGRIFLEAGFDTAKPASEIFEKCGFNTEIIKDYDGNDRIIACRRLAVVPESLY